MREIFLSADRFEEHRPHLRAVAYRILGSLGEAEDAVQETWIKASRKDIARVANVSGWLTTVVGRTCLDMLRSRKSRREDSLEDQAEHGAEPTGAVRLQRRADPEAEAMLADSVGLALLVVLERLSPVERLAFVLHDMFSVPFSDIAPIVERTPETTQRLASRARQRVRGQSAADGDRARRYRAVEAFLQASRDGEFATLLSLLDPEVTFRLDDAARRLREMPDLVGANAVAEVFHGQARLARPVLMDDGVGAVFARSGKVVTAFRMFFDGDRITAIDVIADAATIADLELAVPEYSA